MGCTSMNKKSQYFKLYYSFENALSVPLILNQIAQFLDKVNINQLTLCNRKIYKIYCNLVKKIKIEKEADTLNLKVLIDKYKNINNLDLSLCRNIKDFIPITKLKKLEILNVSEVDIYDISFLEKNKNIKELYLEKCENIIDFSPISQLERLEILNANKTHIYDISFLEILKNYIWKIAMTL